MTTVRRRVPLTPVTALVTALVAALLAATALAPVPTAQATPAPGDPTEPSPAQEAPVRVLETATAALTGERDGAAASVVAEDPTLSLRDLWLARPDLERADLSRARPLLLRPTSARSHPLWRYPGDAEVVRTCTEHVCVHRTTQGQHAATESWAERTLAHLQTSWDVVVDDLGFRAPAPDGTSGGDERFDVYLADLSPNGYYGFCAPEASVPGHPRRAEAYCVLDNDMVGFDGTGPDNLAATVAHEFFHAVQFNLDVAEDTWFMEASATWVERQVFPHVRDNLQFLRHGQLRAPQRPLDSQAGMYGNWLFVHWLARRHGTDVVRRVWQRLEASTGARNEWSLQGVKNHLATLGRDWPSTYRAFTAANLRPAVLHPDLPGLRRARPARMRLTRADPVTWRRTSLDHLSSTAVRIAVGRHAARGAGLQVRLRTGRPAHMSALAVVLRRDGRTRTVALTPDRRGRATVRLPARPARVGHVLVLVTNSSSVYRRCGHNSGWACGGEPVHDHVPVRVRARLLR